MRRRGFTPHGGVTALGGVLVLLGVLLAGCTTATSPDRDAQASPTGTATETSLTAEDIGEVDRAAATLALQDAVAAVDSDAVKSAIARGADLEVRGDGGRTPLVAATKAGHTRIALLLLESGADPDAKDDIEDSAFLYAGAEGLNEILVAAIDHGADVASTNRFGGTALIPASEHGHLRTVELLIEAGVPIDHINNLGWTALHEAIVLGSGDGDHVRVVRALLSSGADPELPDGNGVAPRDLAVARGHWQIVAEIDRALAG
ncbi:hypothetical protein FCK90_01530 [Kocuria coralli]|uniref:Uncharacterized protein n=1 Tax=Kocuria coralli TaxID=1461025 RepID=A0A5J5L262_9MICC|nr:hypothetical protein FCK90_01530 [Kocuria coralli]